MGSPSFLLSIAEVIFKILKFLKEILFFVLSHELLLSKLLFSGLSFKLLSFFLTFSELKFWVFEFFKKGLLLVVKS